MDADIGWWQVRIDHADDDGHRPATGDADAAPGGRRADETDPAARQADTDREQADQGQADREQAPDRRDTADQVSTGDPERTADRKDGAQIRIARAHEHRATVDTAYRAYAIDQGCARVREVEQKIVTPAMRRIEAEDPTRHLAGLEHRLKGQDRLAEKVVKTVNERGHTVEEAFGLVKDAIRYTFCYPDDRYSEGVRADCQRLENAGFKHVDRQNSWAKEQYKGINSRWRVPESGQLFEVQFHTQASLVAKETTHPAYEKLRVGVPTPAEQRELEDFQKRINTHVPTPPGAMDIPDYQ